MQDEVPSAAGTVTPDHADHSFSAEEYQKGWCSVEDALQTARRELC